MSERKNRWSRLLRANHIGMKHLIALKLYTDYMMCGERIYRENIENHIDHHIIRTRKDCRLFSIGDKHYKKHLRSLVR